MYDLLIIGAGPAGISMAVETISIGVKSENVVIIEKFGNHSFSIRRFYPDKKLVTANYKGNEIGCKGEMCIKDLSKGELITYIDSIIDENSINVKYKENVYEIVKDETSGFFTVNTDKMTYVTKVVVVAIGIFDKPNKPSYKIPVSLKDKVLFELTSFHPVDSNVLVVGGGDSAGEYAVFLAQKGNNVTFSYRQNKITRMNDINKDVLLKMSKNNEIELILGSNIEKIEEKNEKPIVTFIDEKFEKREYDYVVYALGGTTPQNFLQNIGIDYGSETYLKDNFETNVSGMYLIGDLSSKDKGGSIIAAFNSAKESIASICKDHLKC